MPTNLEQRIEMLRQMLATYDREPTEDRMKGYLTVTNRIPLGSLPAAITRAMETSGAFPPGPGDILRAWIWQARYEATPPTETPQEAGHRLGTGDTVRQIEGTVGEFGVPDEMKVLIQRAKEIHAEGRYVPSFWKSGFLLAHIKAALELEMDWPIDRQTRDVLSNGMRVHESMGGDGAWWWEEMRHRTVTKNV